MRAVSGVSSAAAVSSAVPSAAAVSAGASAHVSLVLELSAGARLLRVSCRERNLCSDCQGTAKPMNAAEGSAVTAKLLNPSP